MKIIRDKGFAHKRNTVRRETLAPGKFGEFGECLRIRKIIIRQIFLLVKLPRYHSVKYTSNWPIWSMRYT